MRVGLWRTALLITVLSCLPSVMCAAPTFVQVAANPQSSSSASVSIQYPQGQTAGNLDIVVVGWNDTTSNVQSVTDSAGNVYKLAVGPKRYSGLSQSIYYASGISSGSNTVTVQFDQSVPYPDVRVLEYAGVTALDATGSNNGSSTTSTTGGAVTNQGNELIFGANRVATTTSGAGSGFASRIITPGDGDIAEDRTASTAGKYATSAALSSSGAWVMEMTSFAPAADAAPQVSSVSANSGPTSGGTAVTITGTGFAGGAKVYFGNTAATTYTVVSNTQISATTPAGTAGTVAVEVTNPDGQSGSLLNGFTYGSGSTGSSISFVQVAAATPGSPTQTVSVTYPSAETAGDFNVVVVGWNDSTSTVQSVTDSAGNSYRLAIGPTTGTGLEQSIYYAPAIAAGSDTVTVTFSDAVPYPDIRVLEYRGIAALDAKAGASGSGTAASSGTATTTQSNELIFGAETVSSTTASAGSGFTSRIITSPDSDIAEDETVSSTGSYSATATLGSSGSWVMQMATFAPGAVSGNVTPSLNGLSCGSSSETGAANDACTVSLSAAAPTAGVTIALSSNNSALSVPSSVTVPAGASSAGFTASASAVSTTQTATVTASAGGVAKTFSVQLNATSAALTLSSASVAFGNVDVNSTSTQSVTLTSSGTSAVTINSGSIAGTGFSMSGAAFPVTLNPGQSVTLDVQFAPKATGSVTGSVALATNASSGSTKTIALSGTGQTASYSVDLTWAAPGSSSDPVSGYKVYREVNGGSYQALNSSADTSTAYTDSTVQGGTTYNYYVVSVDASGNQSSPSNVFTVAIP